AGEALQSRRRFGVVVQLDGDEEGATELGLRAEKAGVEELPDRPQVADVVLDRGAGQGDAVVGPEGASGPGLFRLGVLDVLRLVEDDARPGDLLEQRAVTVQQG